MLITYMVGSQVQGRGADGVRTIPPRAQNVDNALRNSRPAKRATLSMGHRCAGPSVHVCVCGGGRSRSPRQHAWRWHRAFDDSMSHAADVTRHFWMGTGGTERDGDLCMGAGGGVEVRGAGGGDFVACAKIFAEKKIR